MEGTGRKEGEDGRARMKGEKKDGERKREEERDRKEGRKDRKEGRMEEGRME